MAPTSTAGATGTAGTAGSFILANAARPKDAPAASTTSAAVAPTYRLDAVDSQLSPHVGHRVAITGTVESAMAGATAPSASTTASAANAPRLKVESLKMIAASCAP
jgi:hypothetical protein